MSALKICPQCGTEYPLSARFCENDGSTLRAENPSGDLVGSVVADRYHIMKKLGEGGMGQVYLAEHVKMGRKSAIKVMTPSMVADTDAISRFNREAANASRINHPNVAAIYDFGETSDGLIYLAMEFIDGESLSRVLEKSGALTATRAASITRQIADGLTVAHDMDIVHRDLKPDNIMIARARDGGDLVKVVDFGIAKATQNEAQKVTKTGLVVGTPEYMSPEQLAGDKIDRRSDIYALGLMVFNMLTGKLPFPSETVQEAMIMRLTDRPRTLAEMRPDVAWPAPLQAALDKVLERDVELRYRSAVDFARDMSNAVVGMPSTAPTEMRTIAMHVPATAVRPSSGAMRTAAVPTPVAGGPLIPETPVVPMPAVTEYPTAPSPKKSLAIPIGAAAAVLLIGGAVYAFTAGKSNGEPRHSVESGAGTPSQPAVVQRAKLQVQAPVGATILLNGTQVGSGSWTADTLAPGAYHVVASIPGAECAAGRAEQQVTLAAGTPTSVVLQPTPCTVVTKSPQDPVRPPPQNPPPGTRRLATINVAELDAMIDREEWVPLFRKVQTALRQGLTHDDSATALTFQAIALVGRDEPGDRQQGCPLLARLRNDNDRARRFHDASVSSALCPKP